MRKSSIVTASLLVCVSIPTLAVTSAIADPAPAAQVKAALLSSKEASAIGKADLRSGPSSCLEDFVSPGGPPHTRCQSMFFGPGPKGVRVTIGTFLESYASPEEASAALAQHASTAHGVTTSTPTEVVVRFMSGGRVKSVQVSQVSGSTVSIVECVKDPRASQSVLTTCARKGAEAQLAKLTS